MKNETVSPASASARDLWLDAATPRGNGSTSLCVRQLIENKVRAAPSAPAILAPGLQTLTFGGLERQIAATIKTLQRLGVRRNDRIAVILPNSPEIGVLFFSITSCAAFAPLNPAYREEEFEFYLSDLKAKAVILLEGDNSPARTAAHKLGIPIFSLRLNTEREAGIFELSGTPLRSSLCGPENLSTPEDVAMLLHTSGTTSRPKLVPLTHVNLITSALNLSAAYELSDQDRCLGIMPLFHIHGLAAMLNSLITGGSCVVTPGFIAPKFFEWLDEFRPTWFTASPAIHQLILERAPLHPDIAAHCHLRFLRSASSAIHPQTIEALEQVFHAPVINAYGMSEAAPAISCTRLPPHLCKPGSVGTPLGTQVAIIDERWHFSPAGSRGEIVIRGANVIAGYENNPEANRHSFQNGWFRTGDLGYLDGDGHLFITGRAKEIINRGGEKISPQEVEVVLLDHPAVAQAATFGVEDRKLGEDLAAVVVLRDDTSASERELREFAARRLTDFKVPRRVFIRKEIPLGSTGKVQRLQLAQQLGVTRLDEEPVKTAGRTAPRNSLEEQITQIWSEVLGISREKFGVHDNFFHLGGDSILATQLVSRVRKAMDFELSILSLFEEASSVAGTATLIEAARTEKAPRHAPPLKPIPRVDEAKLSFAQQRLWFLDQLEPNSAVYNISRAIRLNGPLKIAVLEKSLSALVQRHEILRTVFPSADGHPVQKILPAVPIRLSALDLSGLPESEHQEKERALAAKEASRPFDLTRGPLLRASLVKLGETTHLLLLTLHHIVTDGWSMGVLFRELTALYEGIAAGNREPLPPLPVQYADYAAWQEQWLEADMLKKQLAYWKEKLAGAPPLLDLPTDRPRPAVQSHRGAKRVLTIRPELARSLRELARGQRATLFMALLAGFQSLLHRESNQNDIVVGSPISGRNHRETEELIGFFVNTLVLRSSFDGSPTFRELLGRVRETALGAYANQDAPFEKLVEIIRPRRSPDHSPLFQAMFVLQNAPLLGALKFSDITLTRMDVDGGVAMFDLTLSLVEEGGALRGTLEYNTDLFDASTIDRMLAHFQNLLESAAQNPDERISKLEMLPPPERRKLLIGWNDTAAAYPRDARIHELFERQAERTPHAEAVSFQGQELTYGELNTQANLLARRLQQLGVGPNVPVAIYAPRSLETMVAVLAVLKAGGAYVPFDPATAKERLAKMLKNVQPLAILTSKSRMNSLPDTDAVQIDLDEIRMKDPAQQTGNPKSGAGPDDLAYVIHTSGSTGQPKGVAMGHRPLVSLVHWQLHQPEHAHGVRTLQFSSLNFDVSFQEMFTTWCSGGTLVLVAEELRRDPVRLLAFLDEQKVERLFLPFVALQHLAEASEHAPRLPMNLREIITAGEQLKSTPAIVEFFKKLGNCRLHNHYGPTESHVVTFYTLDGQPEEWPALPPIGRPISNARIYLLNEDLEPVPVGTPGELHIGGICLARGYINRPDLTAEKFIPDPFTPKTDGRLYKTGDLARYRPDGQIEFLGRIDHQVKIRGYRVEPGEIEIVLGEHPRIKESAVVIHEDRHIPEKRLAAYIVAKNGGPIDDAELRAFLKDKLPDYMIPSAFVILEKFPLTASNKVDRLALPIPNWSNRSVSTFISPRTRTEKKLAGIWSEVLDIPRIGVRDNFFEIGGHSLSAVRVISKIKQVFDRYMPLTVIFRAPTVEQLALALNSSENFDSWSTLVPIQPNGTLPPIFWAHTLGGGGGGGLFRYAKLAELLGPDQPSYGIQAPPEPFATLPEMAAHYLKAIKAVQPSGPYRLAGYCFGGNVAFEIAQQLHTQGDQVSFLGVIETGSRVPQRDPPSDLRSLLFLTGNVFYWLWDIVRQSPRDLVGRLERKFRRIAKRISKKTHEPFQPDLAEVVNFADYPVEFRKHATTHWQALLNYHPRPYPNAISYFRVRKQRLLDPDVTKGWGRLAQRRLDVKIIPGFHETVFDEPYVRFLAREMKLLLEKAGGATPTAP